jgi:bifunctional DNA-binding transcriptional regulator/antitoxin component of YhaV-PrlF toxin-antitoxin module
MRMATISKGGQISIPADVRRRWGTTRVFVRDEGDVLVITPLPDDPLAAARGALRQGAIQISSDEARRRTRADEAAAHPRRGSGR